MSKSDQHLDSFQNTYSNEEISKAAYALNLCTVSVSQIVDYDDLMVLEQEYDGVLNNLNLHNMPKDEALLKILKQILDTVTFFRIQEGDKQMLEKRYQRKVKNAIWNSLPNLTVVLATDNPWAAIGALATQVGISYMNYRRAKCEAADEHEERQWELMRAAIEQFNALRRDLFDTAWRLAKEYQFPDNYRLTERQITQYDQILMDTNPFRQYERLYEIRQNFLAYPPFFYYLGHAAASIATNEGFDDDCRNEFLEKAINAFETFSKCQEEDLLRKNPIRCSGLLEYIEILHTANNLKGNQMTDEHKIETLIDKVIPYAENDMDILQYVATSYLKIGCFDKAMNVLRRLVREGFNVNTNAIFLSYLYQYSANNQTDSDYKQKYNTLKRIVDPSILLPWDDVSNHSDNGVRIFIRNQKDTLSDTFKSILKQLISKHNFTWNKFFYEIPGDDLAEDDNLYMDLCTTNAYRNNHLFSIFRNHGSIWRCFIDRLKTKNILYYYNEVINACFSDFCRLSESTIKCEEYDIEKYEDSLKDCLYELVKKYDEIKDNLDKDVTDYNSYILPAEKFSLFIIFEKLEERLVEKFDRTITNMEDINSYIQLEESLFKFCQKEGLVYPNIVDNKKIELALVNDSKHSQSAINLSLLWNKIDISDVMNKIMEAETNIYLTSESPRFVYYTDVQLQNISKKILDSKSTRSQAAEGGQIIAYLNNGDNTHLFIQEKGLTVVETQAKTFSDFVKRFQEEKNILSSVNYYPYELINVDSEQNFLCVRTTLLGNLQGLNLKKYALVHAIGAFSPLLAAGALGIFLASKDDQKIFECESLNIDELYKCIKDCEIILKQSISDWRDGSVDAPMIIR